VKCTLGMPKEEAREQGVRLEAGSGEDVQDRAMTANDWRSRPKDPGKHPVHHDEITNKIQEKV
jgi:hypothetical protein